MKTIIKSTISLALVLFCLLSLSACGNSVSPEGLWETATYLEDTTFGEGAKTFSVEVKVGEDSVTFTVNTDKDNVGDALIEEGLIEGEEGAYGWFVTKVDGEFHNWDDDGKYWALYIDGEYAMTGVSSTPVTAGTTYTFKAE